jgi:hypothetical protein
VAPALAAVPSAGLPDWGKLVRQMPARAVPEALRAERVRIRGTGRLAGPLRGMRAGSPLVRGLWSGPRGPALPVRLPSSQVLVQDGAMAAAAREESPPSRVAQRTSRSVMTRFCAPVTARPDRPQPADHRRRVWAKLMAAGLTLNTEDLSPYGTPAARASG